jgi:PAS domain S-box-containing protein
MATQTEKSKAPRELSITGTGSAHDTPEAATEVLRRSEARFRALIENNADAILVIDALGVVRFANPASKTVFGRSNETLTGQQFGFPLGSAGATTIEVIDAAGSLRNVEMRVADIDWAGEQAYLATLRDVSVQIETNRRLAESEMKFRTLFENSKDAICFIAGDGRLLDCNQACENVFGYPLRALLKMSFWDLYEDPDDPVFFQFRIETQGAVKNYPLQIVTREGELRICLMTAALVRSEQDTTVGYQAIIRDMTELMAYRRKLETQVAQRTQELNASLAATEYAKRRIDDIIVSVGDGLIVTDARQRVELINPAAAALLALPAAQVIGRPVDAVLTHAALRDHMLTCFEGAADCRRLEFEIPGEAAGRSKNIRALTTVLTVDGGALSGTVTLLADVTYEHEINRMKSEFISTAAHELRTPLTSICGFSEILLTRSDLDDHERERFLQYIFEQAKVLAAIINDLLDLSRIEAGAGFAVNKEAHDIADMVRSIAERFQLETSRHTFFLDLPPEPLTVICDRGKIEQVLDNLYSNAVKYSPEGGIVETDLHVENGQVDLSIKDSGIGMTPEQVDRVFEKFYRADASNTAIGGTGLGMSIVRHIVESHGGRIAVESRPGVGTTVAMRIPVEVNHDTGNKAGEAGSDQQLPLWKINN